jgi:hypothetical protein
MKTIKINWIALTYLFCLFATLPTWAQNREEKKAFMERKVNETIHAKQYKINVDYMYPQRGGGRTVTSNDSLFSYLPYFGVAHRAPYGGGKGLVFDAPINKYEAKKDKKGRIKIELAVRNEEDSYTYHITLYSNGSANIDVQPNNKDQITFSGKLEVEEPKKETDKR